jgi:hypothetical protein
MWLAAAAFVALAPTCDCKPAHPAERLYAADMVFTGRVLVSAGGNVEYRIARKYKGKPASRVKVFDLADACGGAPPVAGREYLVLARRSAGLWVTGPCEGAIAIEKAGTYLASLRSSGRKRPASNLVTGQVMYPPRVRSSALVRLRRGTEIHYATADETGLFAIEDVPEGNYTVEAVAPGLHAVKAPAIHVARKGITRAYIPMEIEKTRKR